MTVILLSLVAGCRSSSTTAPDVAGAYATIVDWFADRMTTSPDLPVVFVVARGDGFDIELSLQAAIVHDTEDRADVRFLDDPEEAFGDDGRVRVDRTLLAVGPAVSEGRDVTIDVDEVTSADAVTSRQFVLRAEGDDWSLIGSPSVSDS